jgi:hypothetical protein
VGAAGSTADMLRAYWLASQPGQALGGSRDGSRPSISPGGLELAEGYGVMEDHDVLW